MTLALILYIINVLACFGNMMSKIAKKDYDTAVAWGCAVCGWTAGLINEIQKMI